MMHERRREIRRAEDAERNCLLAMLAGLAIGVAYGIILAVAVLVWLG